MAKKSKKEVVKRTERGWIGHYILADKCLFRRNTLLEYSEIKIVVSTVGLMLNENWREDCDLPRFSKIGLNRYFETKAFHANKDKRYYDADVRREVSFTSQWMIAELDADDKANDMHEEVVKEISEKLQNGEKFEAINY